MSILPPPRRAVLPHGPSGMLLRDALAMEAPVTVEMAVGVCGWTEDSPVNFASDAERQTVWCVMALLRYEYADAMLAQRADAQ